MTPPCVMVIRGHEFQTVNGDSAANGPALPSVKRFGDCVAGIRALIAA